MKHSFDTQAPDPPSLRRLRDLWIITAGRAVSLIGDTVASTALVLHAHSAGWGGAGVAAVIICGSLPLVLAAPWAGRLVDRADSRRLTVLAAGWEGAAALLIGAVLAVRGTHAVGIVAALTLLALLGAGQAVSGPAWTALLPAAVPAPLLGRAVGVVQAVATVATVSGAALGGMLAATAGTATAMVVDAGTFAALVVAGLAVRARRLPTPDAAPAADGSRAPGRLRAAGAGARVLADDAVLRPLVAGAVLLVACLHVIVVARVFLVRDVLGGGAAAFGLVGTGFPAGMLAGSLLAAGARRRSARLRLAVLGFAGLALGVLGCGLAPTVSLLWVAQVVMGVAFGAANAVVNVLLLERVPDAVRGQALAAFLGAMQACDVGGTLIGGPLAAAVSPRTVYLVAGGLGLALVPGIAIAVGRAGTSEPTPTQTSTPTPAPAPAPEPAPEPTP